jgi:modulator of FtsH protease HflC
MPGFLSSPVRLGAVAVAIVLLGASTYTLEEREHAVITQFGAPVGDAVTTPGLHFRIPFIQQVNRIDRRYLAWDGQPSQVPTRDKRFLRMDSFARWQISDPLVFYQRLGTERAAMSRLDDILDGELRNVIARYDLIEIVRNSNRDPEDIVLDEEDLSLDEEQAAALAPVLGDGDEEDAFAARLAAATDDQDTAILDPIEKGRRAISLEVLELASRRTEDLGVRLLDFQIKRIGYVEEVQQDVFRRMISERQRAAESFRSQGYGIRDRINGERELELQRISSTAFRQAEEIRGRADAEAAAIYAAAFNRDPEFYEFMRGLQTLEEAVKEDSRLVLNTKSSVFRFLNAPR